MDVTKKELLKIGAFCFFSISLALKAWQVRKEAYEVRKLKGRETKISDADKINELKEGEQGLFKIKIQQGPKLMIQRPVRYNQYHICEPSDMMILQKEGSKYLSLIDQQIAMIITKGKNPALIHLVPTGQLVGDIFSIKNNFELDEIGLFKTLYGWFCWGVEYVLYCIRRGNTSSPYRRPAIGGPIIGKINYLLEIVKDNYLIVKCKLENGRLEASVLAESKNMMVEHFTHQMRKKYWLLFLFFAGALISGRLLLNDIRRWVNINMVKKGLTGIKPLEIEDASDDKLCIICYTNTRNMVFFDCRHMIMCWECSQQYRESTCPMCKKEISELKIVRSI